MRRRIVVGGLALTAVVAASVWAAGGPDGETATVSNRSLLRSAEIRGRIEARESLRFGPPPVQHQWNFRITGLAPEGEAVQEGDLLVSFDATEIQRRLMEARSTLATAEKNVEKRITSADLEARARRLELAEAEAEADKLRLLTAVPEDVTAGKELEQARLDLERAEERIGHLRAVDEAQTALARRELDHLRSQAAQRLANVERLEREIRSMTVLAPSAGTVVYETGHRRDKKQVGDNANRMENVVSLPNLQDLRAMADIDEVFAAEVEVGQTVRFALDAFPEQRFTGRIRSVNPAVQQRSWRDPRKMITIDVELLDPDVRIMRPGMRLQGELEILRTEEVPALPLEAIRWRNGRATVEVVGWFGTRTVNPELGRRGDAFVEVLGGLQPGDRVLLEASS